MENIEIVKKRGAVFLLRHEKMPKHELIEKTATYFDKQIAGGIVPGQQWSELLHDLSGAEARARSTAQVRALEVARTLARFRPVDLGLGLDLDLDLAEFLLALVDEIVPKFDFNLDARILDDTEKNGYTLEMLGGWGCGTTFCRSGFATHYAGEQGKYLIKHFGNWLAGALIYLKNMGYIPDFYTNNETALADMKAHAA